MTSTAPGGTSGTHASPQAVGVGPVTVEVVAKIKVALPEEWEPVNGRWQHPFKTWVEKLTYSLYDRRPPMEDVWRGDWKVHEQGEIIDVEVDAGEWGFDCVSVESDSRLIIELVVVER